MVARTPYQCLTLSMLIVPPLLLSIYFMAAFPYPPEPVAVHTSLASLPRNAKSWSIYPEDFYPGGGYVALPHGNVRYWLLGPEKGKKIVLIHGLSIPAIVWKNVAPSLAARGYRVLLYDLYGRGYSDAPQMTYNADLYTTQLALLMQYLRWDKANVIGLSMGGGIAAAFTARFPYLVDEGVGFVASAGLMDSNDISRTAKFMSSPLVQAIASSTPFRMYTQHLANKTATKENVGDDSIVEIVRLQSAHLLGYNRALSSSLRDGPIRGQAPAFQADGFSGKKVLIIHGTKDTTVDPKYAPQIQATLPSTAKTSMVIIDGASHDLTVSHGDQVSDAIANFLR